MTPPKEKVVVDESEWETVTGLVNDVDVWVKNAYFGFKEEYAAIAGTESPMLILVLVNEDGEEVAQQGYSCGSGWVIQDEGNRIEHPLRNNIVKTSIYGQLIQRVKDKLGVPMQEYGSPRVASTWIDLGFHMMQEEHTTVGGDKKTALMPTEFLGEKEVSKKGGVARPAAGAKAPKEAAGSGGESAVVKKLTTMAQSMDLIGFQKAALKLKEVSADEQLLSQVMDDGEEGFWATHQES